MYVTVLFVSPGAKVAVPGIFVWLMFHVNVGIGGLLAAMSKAIAAAGVNISTAEVKTTGNDGRALSLFELKVTNAAQLNNLMHSIAAIDGVMRVSRLGQHNGANHHRV